jgi:hypothetical protein
VLYKKALRILLEEWASEKRILRDEIYQGLHTELEDNGKEASKDYANQYLDKVVPKKPTFDYQYSAGKTTPAPNKTKEGIQTKSPMTQVTRAPKPKTGASFNK